MKRFFGFFLKPWVAITLGVICVALLVWFAGPLLAFADWHPFESTTARILLFVVLLVLWLGKRVVQSIRARIANRRMLNAMAARDAAASPTPEMGNAAQLEEVRQRFAKAMAVMKETRLGEKAGWKERWFGGRKYVYQLPWYLFIGPPGSGKTTALLNSGLQFPLAEKLGNDPIRGVGGTRMCDWWFTDQAVMIDTAGRYTTQDSDALADASEWKEFLSSLKRYRSRQPINGALVTVSVSDLLQLSGAERKAQALAIRARLQELLGTLENSFPIYLLITKADLLAGFMEFFADLDRESRNQVWGVTFDYIENGPAVPTAAEFEQRFDELVGRIDALTLDRIQAERDPQRRPAIYGFAHQVVNLRTALIEFVTEAFPKSQLSEQPMLRGMYLTSGTQEGNPIDRVMGSLARQFGLQRQMLAPLRPTGKAFFLSQLLHGVIFPEAGLAGTNLRWERRLGTLKWVASVTALVLGVGAAIGWSLSFVNNSSYIAEVAEKVEVLKKELVGKFAGSIPLGMLLPLYDRVQGLATTDQVTPSDPRLSYTMGLFQGGKLSAAADQAYHRLLAQTLAPLLANRMSTALKQSGANPVLQYENLKAYVMLREPDRLDLAALRGWVAFDLESQPNIGLSPDGQKSLLKHVDALLSRSSFQDSVTIDTELIAQARAALAATPFPQRVYERLKRQGVGDFPEFKITNVGGPATGTAFTRTSNKPLSEGVPGFFSFNAYYKGVYLQLDGLIKELADEEVWVLGIRNSENAKRATDVIGRESLAQEVKRLYLIDYANTWEGFVNDLTLKRGTSLNETMAISRLLTAAESPVMPVMRAIIKEVSLTDTPVADAAGQVAAQAAEIALMNTKRKLERFLGPAPKLPTGEPSEKIENIVDSRFEALRRSIKAPAGGGKSPLETSLALTSDYTQHLLATDAARKEGRPLPQSDISLKIQDEAARSPEPIKGMLKSLVTGAAALDTSETRGALGKQLAALGEACTKLVGNRYPLTRGSSSDVTPDDFARVFAGKTGMLDDFFQKNLAQLVDTQVKPWKFRDPKMGDSEALRQFQRAAEIRDVFFGNDTRIAQMSVVFKPLDMDTSLSLMNLNVDGQELKYQFGPQTPKTFQWPGPGGTGQIRLQVSIKDPPKDAQLLFEGPWALFRMFDKAQLEQTGQPEKFRANFTLEGKRVQFEITASSARNPFRLPDLQAFQCPRQL
jgi:type VI secretion system protein ImpL